MRIKQNNRGFSLVEIMVVILILTFMIGGVYASLTAGQNSWFNADNQLLLQQSLRQTTQRLSKELRESGYFTVDPLDPINSRVDYVNIMDDAGVNNTDIIRFSMPIVCEAGESIMDANGDVANWGVPLTWGCNDSTCMDADNDCNTLDYSYVDYLVDANNQLIRRVYSGANAVVREDVFADNITDIQAVSNQDLANPELHENVVTIVLTAQRNSAQNRLMTVTETINVYLRNRG